MVKRGLKTGTPRGFTMIELIAVLVVVSVIGAIVINRAMSTAIASRVSQENVIKNHIRFAKATAMKDRKSVV